MQRYLQNKSETHFTVKGIEVKIKNELPSEVEIKPALTRVIEIIPRHLLTGFKKLYIGQYKALNKREIQAMYDKDTKSVYITNDQDSTSDIIDDVVHEIAHSVEETFYQEIYSDQNIEKEFLLKRKKMWKILKEKGLDVNKEDFLKKEYSFEFDMFLYKQVGYQVLNTLLSQVFFSPYAATSLREYFANGFEAFFMKEEIRRLRRISPQLYKKIEELLNKDYEF